MLRFEAFARQAETLPRYVLQTRLLPSVLAGGLKCPVCSFVYGTKWEFNRHLKNKHGLKVVETEGEPKWEVTAEIGIELDVSKCRCGPDEPARGRLPSSLELFSDQAQGCERARSAPGLGSLPLGHLVSVRIDLTDISTRCSLIWSFRYRM